MNNERHDRLARYLHWVSAAVIIWALLSGLYLATFEHGSAVRDALSSFNVSLTTAFTPAFIVRLVHACRARKPAALQASGWLPRIATIVHALLYALTACVLASGLLMMAEDFRVFGLVTVPNPVDDLLWNRWFCTVHRQSCAALGVLVAIHISAVAYHHRAGRRVLARMT